MAKYLAIPKAPRQWQTESDMGWQERPTITVWSEDARLEPTGLVDASGTPLYRLPDRVPLGFHVPGAPR